MRPSWEPASTRSTSPAALRSVDQVEVAPGATVNEGDPLVVVEAMKMETIVPAPRSGTVTEVFVAEGDKVSVGDPLVAIG